MSKCQGSARKVGVVGVEPTRDEAHTILSRTRMPIPPHALCKIISLFQKTIKVKIPNPKL